MGLRARVLCGVALLTVGMSVGGALGQAPKLGPDLVANGGFEASASAAEGWTWGSADATKATMAIDDAVARSGKHSVRFHSTLGFAPHVFEGLSQVVKGLTPGSEYVIRLWVKGKGVGICWFGGGPDWMSRGQLPRGDFDWTQVELRWQAPDVPTDYELRVNVDSETEALWIDDVSFQEVNPLGLEPRVRSLSPEAAVRAGYLLMFAAEKPLTIDGDLGDWPAGTVVTKLPQDAGVVALDRKGDDDLSAALRAAYDSEALYLGIAVRDDVHWAPPEALAWTNDSIQLGLDPRHERTPGGYGTHDCEYSLMLDNDGKAAVQCWQPPQGVGDQSKATKLAAKRAGAETIYEVAIPWSAIGAQVGAGGPVLGLNVLVNDNDGSGRRGYMELTQGIGKVKDPSAYVTAIASGVRSVAVIPGKPIAYVGEPVDLKATVVLGEAPAKGSTVDLAAVNEDGTATVLASGPLPGGLGGIAQLASRIPGDQVPATTKALRVRVLEAGGKVTAEGEAPIEVSDLKTRLVQDAERLRARTAEVVALVEQAEAQGIATDYERVGITVAQDFVDYAMDDLAHDRPQRAEHVLAVVDQALSDAAQALRAYMNGQAKPMLVPRFVTSKVDVRNGAFWADTLVPSTGQKERRPVFFTGYGHFGTVVRDIPKLSHLGANIIQIECGPSSTQPEENVVTDQPVRDSIGAALAKGEADNVMVCLLTSPHYFPGWALKKWPELQKGGGGFFGLAVDAPQARQIFKTHLETTLKAVGDSPALHSVCLSNEPTFTNWQQDPFRRAEFTEYLAAKFGTIDKLNAAWGTTYPSFAEVPILDTGSLPREADMTPLRYEMARFNMLMFSQYHRFMSDVVHATRPGMPTHAKVMCVPANRQHLAWGTDPEQFAWMGDLNGNDCSCMFAGFGDQYAANWIGQNAYYDIQHSMRNAPIFNTEDHIIVDREQRLIPPEHTDFALWQGAIHGRGASTIWVWERTYERTSDFEGSILHRPENVMAVGRVGLDLQRLAPEVVRLQHAPAPIAIIYSLTAQLWSDTAHGAMMTAYEALNACGVPVRFVSEQQAAEGGLRPFRAVIAPALTHAPDSLVTAVAEYCQAGGRLWVAGEGVPFSRDEYNHPREVSLPVQAVHTFASGATARALWPLFLGKMRAERIEPLAVAVGKDGQRVWGVEYRSARGKDGVLVSIANLWGTPQTVRLTANGRRPQTATDLRRMAPVRNGELTLKPLEATILLLP